VDNHKFLAVAQSDILDLLWYIDGVLAVAWDQEVSVNAYLQSTLVGEREYKSEAVKINVFHRTYGRALNNIGIYGQCVGNFAVEFCLMLSARKIVDYPIVEIVWQCEVIARLCVTLSKVLNKSNIALQ